MGQSLDRFLCPVTTRRACDWHKSSGNCWLTHLNHLLVGVAELLKYVVSLLEPGIICIGWKLVFLQLWFSPLACWPISQEVSATNLCPFVIVQVLAIYIFFGHVGACLFSTIVLCASHFFLQKQWSLKWFYLAWCDDSTCIAFHVYSKS